MQLTDLPEDCVAAAVAFTSPRDACIVATVSKRLKEVADSDVVWQKFLPENYRLFIPGWDRWPTNKKLYHALCDEFFLIDGDERSISLDKESGRWCYMLSARNLTIIWSDTPRYWQWISHPDARFPEVAELLDVCWLEIRGNISTKRLSADTLYLAFLVFKYSDRVYGFKNLDVEAEVGISGMEPAKRIVFLVAGRGEAGNGPKRRGDSWLEVELGEFFNPGDLLEKLEVRILGIKNGNWKSGLIIQGIELRPRR